RLRWFARLRTALAPLTLASPTWRLRSRQHAFARGCTFQDAPPRAGGAMLAARVEVGPAPDVPRPKRRSRCHFSQRESGQVTDAYARRPGHLRAALRPADPQILPRHGPGRALPRVRRG